MQPGAGVHRDLASRVHHRHLSQRRAGIGGEQAIERVLGAHARAQQIERARTVARLGEGLGRDGAHARLGPWHDRSDVEAPRLHRNAEVAARGVTRDDREGRDESRFHAGGPRYLRPSGLSSRMA